ncbi:hypothetical protein JCM11641_005901 [Rhodosporidiobolus odoratus]
MDSEVAAASSFLASYLPSTVDDTFSRRLSTALAQRYADHWYPADPERGSACRALIRNSAQLDSFILAAAAEVGITEAVLLKALEGRESRVTLGDQWTLWVDPGCVSLRVDRDDGSSSRDAQLIEIYGKLPESLRGLALSLAEVEAASSIISPPLEPATLSSPTKRSKAIQIVAPPGGRSALQAMTNAALQPNSPASSGASKPTALLASPLIIPPTPVRPLPVSEADVFSPTPASAVSSSSSLLLPPRSPSPGAKYGSLSPTSHRPSSPLGMPLFTRRSSSRNSSVSSADGSGSGSDGEASGTDSLFSASGDSLASLTSAGSALPVWKGADARSRDLIDADGFRVPALPSARSVSTGPFAQHSRNSSVSSLILPPSPSRAGAMSPASLSSGGRSLPGSPTKPRRRGVRGGQGHRSESSHSHGSSVSSIASITSTATPSTPSQLLGAGIERSTTPSAGRSRTETSSSAQTATEYSNGLVKVLGGGVLLGCGGGGGKGSRSTTPSGEPSGNGEGHRRRRRDRGRGGRGGVNAATSPMGSFSTANSPFQPQASPYQGMPPSPGWLQASPYHPHQQQQQHQQHPHHPQKPMQA